MRFYMVLVVLAGATIYTLPASSDVVSAQKIGRHGVWSVYDYDFGDKTVCFAAARPRSAKPNNERRRPVRAYVATWPDIEPGNPGHVRELSFRLGGKVKSAIVKVDGKPFTLFGAGGAAYVLEADREKQIVSEMRRGKTLTIRSANEDGSTWTDVYSLNGVTKALKLLDKHCGLRQGRNKSGVEAMCLGAWTRLQEPSLQEAEDLMAKGVDYAKANYTKEQIAKIGAYYMARETMKFRCGKYTPPPLENPKRR